MIEPDLTIEDASPTSRAALARALLDTAAEVEADERRLKDEIIAAARAGDCDRVIEIVTVWLEAPPAEALGKALPSSADRR